VPSSQRGTALRYAWARRQQALGIAVWATPAILTWEAWLAQQWRNASLHGRIPGSLQLLEPAQEAAIWDAVLRRMAPEDPEALLSHAPALMRAASRASQSVLALRRSAATDEEMLLVAALDEVRDFCRTHGLVCLALASPQELDFLAGSPAPVVVGQPRLSPLQQRLQELYWPSWQMLATPAAEPVSPVLQRAVHPDAEIVACARWCRALLEEDGTRRLLVVSCRQDPGAHTQGAQLWRALAGSASASDDQRLRLLAVEGGEPLHHQALVDDALAALSIVADPVEGRVLLQFLRSPYFNFGSASERAGLQARLSSWGLARWTFADLRQALSSVSGELPGAGRLLSWFNAARALLAGSRARSATGWAEVFSGLLASAGFLTQGALDSRDIQRLSRWGELLDEFAGLDAALPPMDGDEALHALRRLAQQSLHQAATGDAAITFTTQLHEPVVHYDGIWVMGLTENRWPPPPRPDPYVALHEQRRCNWPQAGVTQRLHAARWLQERWRFSARSLVLSYARLEGDVQHRPSALAAAGASWIDADTVADGMPPFAGTGSHDRELPPMPLQEPGRSLRGGVNRLRLQQECAFHAQAQWRLRAEPPVVLTDGVPARLRGMLLHSLLEGIWGELQEQSRLLELTPDGQAGLFDRHWQAAVAANTVAGVAWLSPAVLARERQRAARLVDRVLDLDRGRAPFAVQLREHELAWRSDHAQLDIRIDRVDRTAAGECLVVDYKSGDAGTIHLQDGEARPLQLAIYVAALAQQGMDVRGALLLGLKPARLEYAGVSAIDETIPGRVKPVSDWPAALHAWERELQALLQRHLAGEATLAASTEACRHCHLPAFCRRRGAADAALEEEGADE
jgi:ATP-dependent helicase/nuclease subunit B